MQRLQKNWTFTKPWTDGGLYGLYPLTDSDAPENRLCVISPEEWWRSHSGVENDGCQLRS